MLLCSSISILLLHSGDHCDDEKCLSIISSPLYTASAAVSTGVKGMIEVDTQGPLGDSSGDQWSGIRFHAVDVTSMVDVPVEDRMKVLAQLTPNGIGSWCEECRRG